MLQKYPAFQFETSVGHVSIFSSVCCPPVAGCGLGRRLYTGAGLVSPQFACGQWLERCAAHTQLFYVTFLGQLLSPRRLRYLARLKWHEYRLSDPREGKCAEALIPGLVGRAARCVAPRRERISLEQPGEEGTAKGVASVQRAV